MRLFFTSLLCLLFLTTGCIELDGFSGESTDGNYDSDDDDDDTPQTGNTRYLLNDFEIIVPSDGLPEQVELKNGNNNLDVVRHDGRVYLAWRTAPTHFASPTTTLYIASSVDQVTWDFEAKLFLNTDLREPRFLSFDGKLFLYFAVLGTSPIDFTPQGTMVTQYTGPASWTEPQWIYEEGFIAWRTKVIDDVPYMVTYVGGESIYDPNTDTEMEVHWLTTENGVDWVPVIPDQPVILKGGCSETDFTFLSDGTLIGMCRNEAGDEDGFGSKICRAQANDLGNWQCVSDPKKYDSPLVFNHNDEVYLIGRRNLTATGNYDLGKNHYPELARTLLNELDYWLAPKRTSLWKIDSETLEVSFVFDFPSNGDTCFPGLIEGENEGEYIIYNYTSPLEGEDLFWLQGQLGPTLIYRVTLELIDKVN